eukprot:TRINITY_DN28211_c0_g1_i2.p1 TRINITY_DN28211_c0_g1~~TRINITY_DN28211_c0_g1_i2.p1  ORF type:complete len:138 (+),score=42.75 TRINITY_DN28211_c0_g1_i2:52-465(+)
MLCSVMRELCILWIFDGWWWWFLLCGFFFFSSRRRHTRCREVSWARRCVQETDPILHIEISTSTDISFFTKPRAPNGIKRIYLIQIEEPKEESKEKAEYVLCKGEASDNYKDISTPKITTMDPSEIYAEFFPKSTSS